MTEPYGESIAAENTALSEERLSLLREHFPDVFTEGHVDLDRLRAALGDIVEDGPERYSFTWAGKRDAIRLLQTPSRATLVPDKEESVNFDETRHLFIEGDNLEVLKLLKRTYSGRVKMIYIDPPYNTGNDFVYRDNFADPLKAYLQLTGQADKEGNALTSNPETSGRYHSAWLSMMYPRLFLARQLLREDGVIFVSIDDNEVHDLRIIMNEIFGEENFIADLIWNSTKTVTNTALISASITHNLIFSCSKEYFIKNRHHFRLPESEEGFFNPDNDPRGPWKADPFQVGGERPNQLYPILNPNTGEIYYPNPGNSWKNELKVFEKLMADGRIVFGVSGAAGPQRKRFLNEAKERGRVAKTLWTDIDTTANATRSLDRVFGKHIFDNPKPESLINRFCQLGIHDYDDALVLDFFAGSCTTANSVINLNKIDGGKRQFIMIQLPEPVNKELVTGKNATEMGLETVSDIGKERIRRVIAGLEAERDDAQQRLDVGDEGERNEPEDLGFKVFKLRESHLRSWKGVAEQSLDDYVEQMELFVDPLLPGWERENVIYEVALKEGYGLNIAIEPVEGVNGNEVFRVTADDGEQSFLICLDGEIAAQTGRELNLDKDDIFVCCNVALNDETAANLNLQCRLKTI